jgi:hypothetical protein
LEEWNVGRMEEWKNIPSILSFSEWYSPVNIFGDQIENQKAKAENRDLQNFIFPVNYY